MILKFSHWWGFSQNIEEAEKYYSKIDDFDLKLKIGDYYLNKYHFEVHDSSLCLSGQRWTYESKLQGSPSN